MQGLDRDVILIMIGAGISLFSSIIVLIATNYIQSLGKLRIYVKIVATASTHMRWGVYESEGNLSFHIPLWIEFHNTSSSNKVVRDFNLFVFTNGKMLGAMTQINRIGQNNMGNEGAYSFVIPPQSISRYECHFILKSDSINRMDFDEIRVSYFDKKDKQRWTHMKSIENCWRLGAQTTDGLWISL